MWCAMFSNRFKIWTKRWKSLRFFCIICCTINKRYKMHNIKTFIEDTIYNMVYSTKNYIRKIIYVIKTTSKAELAIYTSFFITILMLFSHLFGFSFHSSDEMSISLSFIPAFFVLGSIWTYLFIVFAAFLIKSSINNLYYGIKQKILLRKEYKNLSKNEYQ